MVLCCIWKRSDKLLLPQKYVETDQYQSCSLGRTWPIIIVGFGLFFCGLLWNLESRDAQAQYTEGRMSEWLCLLLRVAFLYILFIFICFVGVVWCVCHNTCVEANLKENSLLSSYETSESNSGLVAASAFSHRAILLAQSRVLSGENV